MEGTSMVQAYNNMLAGFPIKREVLYPAKNRAELKRVYDNIVSLSKRSPYYKINLSQENQEYAIQIKEMALELKSRLIHMQEPEVSGFQSKTVLVSDENILSARLIHENTESLPEAIEIKVNKLASVQINKGKELLNTSFAFPVGEYQFVAKVGDESYQLKFIQEQRMSNLDTLKNIADDINQSVPGISAMVEKANKKDYSHMTIAGDMSGRFGERSFAFDDDEIYKEGVVDFFGLNRNVQEASYSEFELNGASKQIATNTFHLENVLQISLNRSGEEPVALKITSDSDKILTAVDQVLTTYNNLVSVAKSRVEDSEGHYSASKLIKELKNLEQVYAVELESCGIKFKEDGTLSKEEALAAKAAQDGRMEELFTRKNGFIGRLFDKAEAIAINPMDYMEKTVVTYPNSEKTNFSNPYVTSMYSGMLFSSYC